MEPHSLRHRPAERRLTGRGRADGRLARAAAAGSPAAFAAIFREHAPELHRYCRSIVGNEHDATDVVQSTMLKALEALPGERRTIALRPWLFRVAHNEAIDLLRSRRAHVDLDEAHDVSDRVSTGAIEDRERLRALQADLARLTERQRGALLLRELVGLSFAEIADSFGIAESAAKQSVYEARRALTTLEQGRAMDCDAITRALSDGDRRTLRGRAVRAHLDECACCRAFADGLRRRPADLGALAPPVAAGSLLLPALGAGGGVVAGGGAVAGGAAAGGGFLPSLSALLGLVPAGGKVAATVLAVGAVAGGGTAAVVSSSGPTAAEAGVPSVGRDAADGPTGPTARLASGGASSGAPGSAARGVAPASGRGAGTPDGRREGRRAGRDGDAAAAVHAADRTDGATERGGDGAAGRGDERGTDGGRPTGTAPERADAKAEAARDREQAQGDRAEAKAERTREQAERKQGRADAKAQATQERAEAKQQRAEAKAEAKQERAEAKAERAEDRPSSSGGGTGDGAAGSGGDRGASSAAGGGAGGSSGTGAANGNGANGSGGAGNGAGASASHGASSTGTGAGDGGPGNGAGAGNGNGKPPSTPKAGGR